MLGAPSCPSFFLGATSRILLIADLLILRVDIRRGGVWVVASVPSSLAEYPPARRGCELDRHVDVILGPDVVVLGVPPLHRLSSVEDCCRHDSTATFTTLVFREEELDGLPYRN